MLVKTSLKHFLGELPWMAELYWQMRSRGKPLDAKFDLSRLQKALPAWKAQAEASQVSAPPVREVLLFGTHRYWIEQVTILGMALAGYGHSVTLSYTPYAEWAKPYPRFDTRRRNVYAQKVLHAAEPLIRIAPLLNAGRAELPAALAESIRATAFMDTQYTLQMEKVSLRSDLYQLRLERDQEAAQALLALLQETRPERVIVPNGTILEFGAVYQVARYLGIPVTTYEFGEQRQRCWLAQDAEVMRQDTDALWEARRSTPLTEPQMAQVQALFASRQRASLWESGDKSHRFARRWQGAPSEGGQKVKADLGLDDRPLVLLATNVIGDSLTLGRQVFSDSMTEWLERTVRWFAMHPKSQLVIRIHPGELITKGPSVADVVQNALPEIPPNIHLIPADAKVNTYDLIEIADVGLVYTTTVGMEMAMSGIPVIAVGNTHYRGRGFTLDAPTWAAYFDLLGRVLSAPARYRLTPEKVAQAWNYAYRFFFEYPLPYPWHILHFWDDLKEWPVERVLSAEGQAQFGKTFRYLVGEAVEW